MQASETDVTCFCVWGLCRYFVLNGNTLTYYKDHRSTVQAKGDILLTADATIEEVDDFQHPYTFDVTTPFVNLRLAAANDQERQEWKIAIDRKSTRLNSRHY